MHCGQYIPRPTTRRQMLSQFGVGFGSVALAAMLAEQDARADQARANPLQPQPTHFAPTARNVIFLYMDGGVSQVDSFDPKPRLQQLDGQLFPVATEPTQFDDKGKSFGSPWQFKRYGQSGIPVSDLFPHIGACADDLCVIRSMTSLFNEHTNANYFLHTGMGIQGRPSMGAWVGYGLGSENQNLPGFIVLNGGLVPPGGLDNFNSGFLPASYQGSIFKPAEQPVANIHPNEARPDLQRNKLDLMRRHDHRAMQRTGPTDALESAISNYELAFRMQSEVPDLMDFAGESEATTRMYGFEEETKGTATFAMQCLIARRLVERGVRFIELTCPNIGHDRWDQHDNFKNGHWDNAKAIDQPVGALLRDLKQRGLLDSTLVVWAGEFGRTPFAQGSNGRDHNPWAFSIWMAGGGIKGGQVYGETDELGYKAVHNRLDIHDLHANILHALGIDHTRLTYYFSGRNIRLTDVHGHVVPQLFT